MGKMTDEIQGFLGTKQGKVIMTVALSLLILLAIVRVATPKIMNIFINNGNECQFETLTNKNIKG